MEMLSMDYCMQIRMDNKMQFKTTNSHCFGQF